MSANGIHGIEPHTGHGSNSSVIIYSPRLFFYPLHILLNSTTRQQSFFPTIKNLHPAQASQGISLFTSTLNFVFIAVSRSTNSLIIYALLFHAFTASRLCENTAVIALQFSHDIQYIPFISSS